MTRSLSRLTLATALLALSQAATAQQGQRILAYYETDGFWYPGTVYTISRNTIQMRFDSGEAAQLPARYVKAFDWQIGTAVQCNYAGEGDWYDAEIAQLRGQNLQVVYDEDGEYEWTTTARCRSE